MRKVETLAIPDGQKLLDLVEQTGRLLTETRDLFSLYRDKVTREQLFDAIDKVGDMGDAMLDSHERIQRRMEKP